MPQNFLTSAFSYLPKDYQNYITSIQGKKNDKAKEAELETILKPFLKKNKPYNALRTILGNVDLYTADSDKLLIAATKEKVYPGESTERALKRRTIFSLLLLDTKRAASAEIRLKAFNNLAILYPKQKINFYRLAGQYYKTRSPDERKLVDRALLQLLYARLNELAGDSEFEDAEILEYAILFAKDLSARNSSSQRTLEELFQLEYLKKLQLHHIRLQLGVDSSLPSEVKVDADEITTLCDQIGKNKDNLTTPGVKQTLEFLKEQLAPVDAPLKSIIQTCQVLLNYGELNESNFAKEIHDLVQNKLDAAKDKQPIIDTIKDIDFVKDIYHDNFYRRAESYLNNITTDAKPEQPDGSDDEDNASTADNKKTARDEIYNVIQRLTALQEEFKSFAQLPERKSEEDDDIIQLTEEEFMQKRLTGAATTWNSLKELCDEINSFKVTTDNSGKKNTAQEYDDILQPPQRQLSDLDLDVETSLNAVSDVDSDPSAIANEEEEDSPRTIKIIRQEHTALQNRLNVDYSVLKTTAAYQALQRTLDEYGANIAKIEEHAQTCKDAEDNSRAVDKILKQHSDLRQQAGCKPTRSGLTDTDRLSLRHLVTYARNGRKGEGFFSKFRSYTGNRTNQSILDKFEVNVREYATDDAAYDALRAKLKAN